MASSARSQATARLDAGAQEESRFIARAPAMRAVMDLVDQVAPTPVPLLIEGASGTGKELFAEAIHNLSARRGRTLVKVNCAALPDTLIEAELFGREKGAYTGALTKQAGRFEIADKSTIFLDEIAELSMAVQAKLLRVLQEGQFERLGSSTTFRVDARIVAATNRDLKKAVDEGKFRQDLYYRLCVFPVDVPSLRERAEDIPKLTWHFVKMFNRKMGKRIEHIPKTTMEAMQAYPWPGNVRELRNVIERALIVSPLTKLVVELPTPIESNDSSSSRSLEDVARRHILNVLERTRWRVRGADGAAEILGLKPSTLEFRMKKLDIIRPT